MKKRILLVDDEPHIRVVLSAVLAQAGYDVDTAEDGFVALRKVQNCKPDLVITDLRMPNMNGFELLSVVRTRFPELPTVAISGEFLTLEIHEGLLADAFFQKGSYAIPDFVAKISELLHGVSARKIPTQAPVWTPTASDKPLMLTCTACLRSFPIDACDGSAPPKQAACIFCGKQLQIQLIAIGMASSASD